MATPVDLMGLGVPFFQAGKLGTFVTSVTCAGTTAGSATVLPGQQGLYVVTASNSGSGIALPPVGGDKGCLLGDSIAIANYQGQPIAVYANNNAAGSAVTLQGRNASTAGTTGVSVASAVMGTFWPVTISTWFFDASI